MSPGWGRDRIHAYARETPSRTRSERFRVHDAEQAGVKTVRSVVEDTKRGVDRIPGDLL